MGCWGYIELSDSGNVVGGIAAVLFCKAMVSVVCIAEEFVRWSFVTVCITVVVVGVAVGDKGEIAVDKTVPGKLSSSKRVATVVCFSSVIG